jgi:hypothetical protein
MVEFCLLDGMRFDCARQSWMGTYGGGTTRDKVRGRKKDPEVQIGGLEVWTGGPEFWTLGQEVRRTGGLEDRKSDGQDVQKECKCQEGKTPA